MEMKEKIQKAILTAITVAIGITLATLVMGESFSLFKTGLYAIVAFIVDYLFTCFFEAKKK
ncbi:MAG: hypothetical protein NC231_14925 [Bacillus sp. (in: Bacteria)]|nr:hypothetical protein [Bacillus sp. (in: firmicutes)]